MITLLPALDDLPRQNATRVKNKWGDVVRQVQQSGSVAVTNHSTVEMVLLDARTYRQLVEDLLALKAQERSALDELNERFNERLASLQDADAGEKVAGLLTSKGRLGAARPNAGASF